MKPLPKTLEFSPERIDEAISVQNELIGMGVFNPETAALDGLLAAGVPEELVATYAASIYVQQEVRDSIPQSPFPVGYIVGRSIVEELRN